MEEFSIDEIFETKVLKSYNINNFGIVEIEFVWINSMINWNNKLIINSEHDISIFQKNLSIIDTSISQLESKLLF